MNITFAELLSSIKWFCIQFLFIPAWYTKLWICGHVLYTSLVLRHTRSVSLLSALNRMLICSSPWPLNVWPEILEWFQFWQVWTQMLSFALWEFQVFKKKKLVQSLQCQSSFTCPAVLHTHQLPLLLNAYSSYVHYFQSF